MNEKLKKQKNIKSKIMAFSDWYLLALNYYKEHNNLLVPQKYVTTHGYTLGLWIAKMRQDYKNNQLTKEQINMLENIGMVWIVKQHNSWDKMFAVAKEYSKIHGNLNVPTNYVTANGENLYNWIVNQRKAYHNEKLTIEQIKSLENIGMLWNSHKEIDNWFNMYYRAKEYFKEHGNLKIFYTSEDNELEKLKTWLFDQRRKYQKQTLDSYKIVLLEQIGITWEARKPLDWDKMYTKASRYSSEHGDLNILRSYVTEDNFPLGKWIAYNRYLYTNGKLPQEKISRLEAIGMVWRKAYHNKWDKLYEVAKSYYDKYHNLLVPVSYITSTHERLGEWIIRQRKIYAEGRMSKEKIELLEAIGMVWDTKEYEWNEMYVLAKKYYAENHNLQVSVNYVTTDGRNLGEWIIKKRQAYKNNTISKKEIEALEAIGMIWDVHDEKWYKKYNEAKKYYEKYGNLSIPNNYLTEDGTPLREWLHRQRYIYQKNKLSQDRIIALSNIGMIWNTRLSKGINAYLEELRNREKPIIIDKNINSDILKRISLIELQSKIKLVTDYGVSPVDSNGCLIDIFSMSSLEMVSEFGISLEEVIVAFKENTTIKLNLTK